MIALKDTLSIENVNGVRTVRFTGVNLQVVNGSNATETVNGTGNLIIGYDEVNSSTRFKCTLATDAIGLNLSNEAACLAAGGTAAVRQKTGSHNLVMGSQNSYSSAGGIVAGEQNFITALYASNLGGSSNFVNGRAAVNVAGRGNHPLDTEAAILGGANNTAAGDNATVSGGSSNRAIIVGATVSGGSRNIASGPQSNVTGGIRNESSGPFSHVSGGGNNNSSGATSTVAGGSTNESRAPTSSISGGSNNVTPELRRCCREGSGANRLRIDCGVARDMWRRQRIERLNQQRARHPRHPAGDGFNGLGPRGLGGYREVSLNEYPQFRNTNTQRRPHHEHVSKE